MKARPTALLLLFAVSAPCVPAQAYKTQEIPTAGIAIRVSSKLRRLPPRMDELDPTIRARFESQRDGDKIKIGSGRHARHYPWSAAVYEFIQESPTTGGATTPEEEKSDLQRRVAQIRSRAPTSFEAWRKHFGETQKGLHWITEDKEYSKQGRNLGYRLWECVVDAGPILWHTSMAVYRFDGREVMQRVTVPVDKKRGKPQGPVASLVRTQIRSARQIEAFEAEDSSRDEFANTPARKEALEAAKRNIAGLSVWDYFTTPDYIVIYSFEGRGRLTSYYFAKRLAEGLGEMRSLYQQYYPPLDGMEMPYSVLRVCATYEQFQKYGSSRPGVVGWFSPVSKELVVFKGGDKMMRFTGATEAVTFHEGWHQYANAYFGVELKRWFDEGHGDFFGSHAWTGRSWDYRGSRMRSQWVELMAKKKDYVPFAEIVRWDKKRFYANKAPYYYAQAYGMIDFLRRGAELSEVWDPRWGEILEIYRVQCLETKDSDKAVAAAFDGVDTEKLEAAWRDWVASKHFPKPRRPARRPKKKR